MSTQDDEHQRPRKAGPLRVVLCLDEDRALAVRAHLDELGFEFVADTRRGLDAVAFAGDTDADLVVLDLALSGTLGLRIIPVLRAAAPNCVVVALSPFATLDVAALEAGAHAVIPAEDTRRLRSVLSDLAHGLSARKRP